MNPHVRKTRIGIMLMATALSAMLAACGPVVRSEQKREEMTIKYLEEKYNEEFMVVNARSQNIGEDWFYAKAYAKSHPEFLFNATITADGSRGSDEYISRIVCNKIAARVSSNMNKIPGLFDVYAFRIGSIDQGCKDTEISIEDYVRRRKGNQKYRIEVFFVPDQPTDATRIYDGLKEALRNMEMLEGNLVLFLTEEDRLKEVQEWMYDKGEKGDTSLSIKADMFELIIPYEKGQIGMSESEFTEAVKEIF
ncbi:MAG: hypothetical protein IJR00_07230 [Lachnospiraceae bacterium]|nr:hypothetical protein [Lachnospiraceae bacterium]